MYARTQSDFDQIVPPDWHVEIAMPFAEFIQHAQGIGELLAQQSGTYSVMRH